MRVRNRWSAFLGIAALVGLAACTSDSLDDGDSANSIMTVASITAPGVSGDVTTGTCSTTNQPCLSNDNCAVDETCILDLTGAECDPVLWNATLRNAPKTELGATPYSDIIIQSVTVTYTWFNGFVSPPRTFSLGGTIEPNQTLSVQFYPITEEDLADLRAFAPSAPASANVSLLFSGTMVDGDAVTALGGALLRVEACN